MEPTDKKRLVMIGIRRRGEKGFKITKSTPKIEPFVIPLAKKEKVQFQG